VTISPQGNYHLVWTIGRSQRKQELHPLETCSALHIPIIQDAIFGAVSFEIAADGHLEGRWSSMSGTTCGQESLTWKKLEVP
jgi:hypothetical protein